jgi:hypothetical protein
MNIEDIICSNNSDIYLNNLIPIKKFLLKILLQNKEFNIKYNDCINYFILNNDINFLDSISSSSICLILYNCLNDPLLADKFNNNEIIISKSLNIFNQTYKYEQNIYSLNNINLKYENEYIYEKIKLLDSMNILQSIYVLDDLINYINIDSPKFIKMYNKYNNVINICKNELLKRIKYNDILVKKIYYYILNENLSIDNIIENKDNLINALRIVTIFNIKINELLDKNKNIDENIDYLFENEQEKICNIFKLFNNSNNNVNVISSLLILDTHTIILYKKHIKNMYDIYNNVNLYNLNKIDIIEFVENIFDEYEQINKLLELYNDNDFDYFFDNLIKNIQQIPNNDDKVLIKLVKIIIEFLNNLKEDKNLKNFEINYNDSNDSEQMVIKDSKQMNMKDSYEKIYLKREIDEIKNLFCVNFFEYLFLILNVNINHIITKNKLIELENYKNEIMENMLNNSDGDLESFNDILYDINIDLDNYNEKISGYEKQINNYMNREIPNLRNLF